MKAYGTAFGPDRANDGRAAAPTGGVTALPTQEMKTVFAFNGRCLLMM